MNLKYLRELLRRSVFFFSRIMSVKTVRQVAGFIGKGPMVAKTADGVLIREKIEWEDVLFSSADPLK